MEFFVGALEVGKMGLPLSIENAPKGSRDDVPECHKSCLEQLQLRFVLFSAGDVKHLVRFVQESMTVWYLRKKSKN